LSYIFIIRCDGVRLENSLPRIGLERRVVAILCHGIRDGLDGPREHWRLDDHGVAHEAALLPNSEVDAPETEVARRGVRGAEGALEAVDVEGVAAWREAGCGG
jgi:hypothetical protein